MPVSLHLERQPIRVRDRLSGRRRDGRLGRVRRPGIRPIPTNTSGSAATSCRRATAVTSCGSPTSSKRRCSSIGFRLVAVDHPGDVEVFPERRPEGAAAAAVQAVRDARRPVPRAAVDDHGHDVTRADCRASTADGPTISAFVPIRGYAEPHTLDARSRRPTPIGAVLLLTGWTDYAFSTDNVAASQSRTAMQCPSLQVAGCNGRVADDRSTTSDSRLAGRRRSWSICAGSGSGRLARSACRLSCASTGIRFWSTRPAADAATDDRPRSEPSSGRLHWRGFSAEDEPRRPRAIRLRLREACRASSPWKVMPGRYTREGDVRPLLTAHRRHVRRRAAGRRDCGVASTRQRAAAPPGWRADVPALCRRLQQGNGHPVRDARQPRAAAVSRDDEISVRRRTSTTRAARRIVRYLERYNTRVVARPLPSIRRWPPG